MSVPGLKLTRDDADANPDWDRFVAAAPGGHHVQTAMWARVKASAGWHSCRIILRREADIAGGCQMLWREVGRGVRVAYVPRGPLVRRDQPVDVAVVLNALEAEARKLRLAYVKLQPPTDRHDLEPVLEERGFVRSKLEVGPVASVRVDLRRSPEDLLAALAPRVRRNLRQSEREGLVVRKADGGELPVFLDILDRTAERQGFKNYPRAYWMRAWAELAPSGAARLSLAELDGRALSGLLLVGFGDTVIYKMGGWTGERTKARPSESIHWNGLLWAREAGFRYYDFEGIPPGVARAAATGEQLPASASGVATFKLSFGGEPVFYPGTYDARYQPLRARAAQWAGNRRSGHRLVRLVVGRRPES
jgi:lipid II:glycine glycyltransferase (peptidoglycan interpeptide bridge formation enzyme)